MKTLNPIIKPKITTGTSVWVAYRNYTDLMTALENHSTRHIFIVSGVIAWTLGSHRNSIDLCLSLDRYTQGKNGWLHLNYSARFERTFLPKICLRMPILREPVLPIGERDWSHKCIPVQFHRMCTSKILVLCGRMQLIYGGETAMLTSVTYECLLRDFEANDMFAHTSAVSFPFRFCIFLLFFIFIFTRNM